MRISDWSSDVCSSDLFPSHDTLAYRSFGEDSGRKEKTIQKGQEITVARRKSPLVVVGVSLLLVTGLAAVFFQKMKLTGGSNDDGKLYGFVYKPGLSEGLKSSPNGAPIFFTLENNTDVSLELRWYDFEGRPKNPDNLNKELSDLGPGKKFQGTTGWGNAFALFDPETQIMLGSFRFVSGTNLSLVAEKNGDKIFLEPKFLRKAEAGDGFAQAQLSEAFWEGFGVPQNTQQAAKWAKMSFDQENSFGLCMYAALLDSGAGVRQDSQEALYLWERAANAGEGWAYAKLGHRYLQGYGGVNKDYAKAVSFLQVAASKGNHWAMGNLGQCYENGWGVPVDWLAAEKLYRSGAEGGRHGVLSRNYLAALLEKKVRDSNKESSKNAGSEKAENQSSL